MRRHKITAILLALTLGGCLYGCGDEGNLTAEVSEKQHSSAKMDSEFGMASTAFALHLMQEAVKQEGNGNILLSPYSLMQSLAMTANGAAGETRSELEQTLGAATDALNESFLVQRKALSEEARDQFKAANSVWLRNDKSFTLKDTFRQNVVDYYDADVYSKPFRESTRKDINKWGKEKTDGRIPEILSEPIGKKTVMYLVNAVSFDAKWASPYIEPPTPCEFEAANGEHQPASLMCSYEQYICDENARGFIKPYQNEKYAFAAILPNEEMTPAEYLAQLTPDGLYGMLNQSDDGCIGAGLPNFQLDYNSKLIPILEKMGVNQLFGSADLSEMTENPNDFYVNEIVQKTHIEVDTLGTKAATTTHESIDSAIMETEVVLNRPFLYLILDTETHLPIFFGVLNEMPQ